MGGSRLSIVSLIIFFGIGIWVLTTVNVERGIQVAQKEEADMLTAAAA
jgi:UMF1 family MFS transporter